MTNHSEWSDMELREECGYIHGLLRGHDDMKKFIDEQRMELLKRLATAQKEIERRNVERVSDFKEVTSEDN